MPKVSGHFIKEVMRVYNKDSDTSTYWLRKCDVWCRVGLEDYRKDQREAAYIDCLLTETTGNLTRHYSTLHYIY